MCHMCNASRDISPLVLVLLVPAGQPPGVQGVVGRHGGRGAKLQVRPANIQSLVVSESIICLRSRPVSPNVVC